MATKKTKTDHNGLKPFAMHTFDRKQRPMVRSLAAETVEHPIFAFAGEAGAAGLDAETAARGYMEQALASNVTRGFAAPSEKSGDSDFKIISTETVPLTKTTVVKFRQRFNDVPVYGSLVSVELDGKNNLVGINSSMGDPNGLSAIAKVSQADAVKAIGDYPGYRKKLDGITPRIYYYYDQAASKWRLVFAFEDVPVKREGERKKGEWTARVMDYLVDAHTGKVAAELPRSAHAAQESAMDGKDQMRQFGVDGTSKKLLFDRALNVQTFDFRFGDPVVDETKLPGRPIGNPPKWNPAAVSAHANASVVSNFLRTELGRNNIDNQGGIMKSSINCVDASDSPEPKVWINAFWNSTQMVYGQRKNGSGFLSMCIALDVVAHEMFHGVTENTARLVYRDQSGAMNESMSDIFGIIVANYTEPDINKWSWEIGAGLTDDGKAFRSMQDPTLFQQPAHMKDYQKLPPKKDSGGVHTNSGIHNKAAYNMLTAKSAGGFALTPKEVIAVFYLALSQQLAATSQFSDSRRGVLQSAQTLFRDLPQAEQTVKLNAINKAFDDVGIV